jgi:hypothetical protein
VLGHGVHQHPDRAAGGRGHRGGRLVDGAGAQVAGEAVGDGCEPAGVGEHRPPGAHPGVDVGERLVRVAHLRELVGRDPGGAEHAGVPAPGPAVEQAGPRGRGRARRRRPQQAEVHVLAQGRPPPRRGEQVGVGLAQPAQPGREVAAVQPAPGALLHLRLVELAAQRGDLRAAPGVGVGVAGAHRPAVGPDPDQRGRERVQRHAGDPALQRPGDEVGDDLRDLLDHLVRVDLAGAVPTRPERVLGLPAASLHRPAGGVVHVAPARRRADVERDHEGVQRLLQRDPVAAHPVLRPAVTSTDPPSSSAAGGPPMVTGRPATAATPA